MDPTLMPILQRTAGTVGETSAAPAARRGPLAVRLGLLGFLVTTACFGGQVQVRISPTEECRLEFESDAQILFYPQVHATDDMGPKDRAPILISQFLLARFLVAHPDYEVFLEGSPDLGPADLPADAVAALRAQFPGLECPGSLGELKGRQQSALIRGGAPMMLLGLGKLPRIHAALPEDVDERLGKELEAHWKATGTDFEDMDSTTRDIIYAKREQAAADHVKAFLAAHPSAKVLIVFGMAHDFRNYFPDRRYSEISGLETLTIWKTAAAARAARKEADERKEPGPREAPAKPGGPGGPGGSGGVDALHENHRTRLMNAITGKDLRLVKALLAEGANVRLRDRSGYTPLLLAGLGGDPVILEEILKHVTPSDVHAPVTLVEAGVVHTYEDMVMVLEAENAKHGKDYFDVIQRLRTFSTPKAPARKPGASPARKAPQEAAPGFLGDLGRYLPAWL